MKSHSFNLRINRLVIDAPLAEGVTVGALAEGIRSELASRISGGPAEASSATWRKLAAPPLAGRIVDAVAPQVREYFPQAVLRRHATSSRNSSS
jgi:hypothetical protein